METIFYIMTDEMKMALFVLNVFIENTDYSKNDVAVIEPTDCENEFNIITQDGIIWYANIKTLEFSNIGVFS